MSRTREKAKGRKGGEAERFAYLPESVLQSTALATAPHAALRVLTILVIGKPKERNGTMMCTDSYAAKFGLNSHDTLHRSLVILEQRGLITTTRRAARLGKVPALFAVTWWPIYNRDGQPLQIPNDATHAYLEWTDHPDHRGTAGNEQEKTSPRPSGDITPTIGAKSVNHHPVLTPKVANHHPDYRGHSNILVRGQPSRRPSSSDSASESRSVKFRLP